MSSSHERVLAALELREPDTVPVFDLISEFGTTNENGTYPLEATPQ